MRFDLHMHTRLHSPCSVIDPNELIRQAIDVGLDGIVITEHDYLWTEKALDELRAKAPNLIIMAGVEISANGGDLLVYGVKDPFKLAKGMHWPHLCDEIHRQGGVAVAAHPYRWGQKFDDLLSKHKPAIDGIEMMSSNMDDELRRLAAEFHRKHPHYAGFGNSDAHEVRKVGMCYTDFDADIRSMDDLVQAIRNRRTTPRVR